jgi:hypothetical protein
MVDLFQFLQQKIPSKYGEYIASHIPVKIAITMGIAFIVGFMTFYIPRGGEGQKPKIGGNFQIYLHKDEEGQNQCFHIHHWIITLTIIGIIWITILCNWRGAGLWIYFITGFMIGAFMEDLQYPDVFDFCEVCNEQ